MPTWTPQADRLLRRYLADGCYLSEVAELLGRPLGAVRKRAEELGLSEAWSPDADRQLRELLAAGRSYADISLRLNRSEAAVRQRAESFGLVETPKKQMQLQLLEHVELTNSRQKPRGGGHSRHEAPVRRAGLSPAQWRARREAL